MAWLAPLACGGAAVVLVVLVRLLRHVPEPAPPVAPVVDPITVRLALVLVALMVVWCLEDPAREVLTATPVGRARLAALRSATALLAAVPAVVAVLAVAGLVDAIGPLALDATGVDLGRYLLEVAALAAVGLALAAGVARWDRGSLSAHGAAAGLLGLAFASLVIGSVRRVLWLSPRMDDRGAVVAWTAVLAVGVVVTLVVMVEPRRLRDRRRGPAQPVPSASPTDGARRAAGSSIAK